MSTTDRCLNVVFDESGKDPAILKCFWSGDPNPLALNLGGHPNKRVRVLAITLLLAKYHENTTHPMERPIRFGSDHISDTWILTVGNLFRDEGDEGLKARIIKSFKLQNEENLFVSGRYGSRQQGGQEAACVDYFPRELPLQNLLLVTGRKDDLETKNLNGKHLLDFAIKLEGKRNEHWGKLAVKELCSAYLSETAKPKICKCWSCTKQDNEKGKKLKVLGTPRRITRPKDASPTGLANIVAEFLENLARKGLDGRMIFPPPRWVAHPLRDFCIEPKLLTEAQWEEHRRQSKSRLHEMELPSNESMRGKLLTERAVSLRQVLGDEHHVARHRRIILRGNPGEGKSTALWLHIGNLCTSLISRLNSGKLGIDSAEFKVPLVLPLGDSKREKTGILKSAIEKVLEISFEQSNEGFVQILRKWLEAKIKRGEYTLALDALDELSFLPDHPNDSEWLHAQIQHIPPHIPILLTTRPTTIEKNLGLNHGQAVGQFEVYWMTCFDSKQVRHYIRGYFGDNKEKAEVLLSQLRRSPGPKQLAQLPLLLAALCHVHDENDPGLPLPTTRAELFNKTLWCLFDSGHKKRALKENVPSPTSQQDCVKEVLLQYLAWSFWKGGPLAMCGRELSKELSRALELLITSNRLEDAWAKEPAKQLNRSRLIQEFCEDGILVSAGVNQYRFVLLSLQEYLVAGYLASAREAEVKEHILKLIREKQWFHHNWKCIWPLAAGQRPHIAKQLLKMLEPLLCHLEALDDHSCDFPGFLAQVISEGRLLQTDYWIDVLVGSTARYNQVVDALGEIGGEKAEGILLKLLLEGPIPSARMVCFSNVTYYHIRNALSIIASVKSRDALIKRLTEPIGTMDPFAYGPCFLVLGEIGDTISQEFLITTICNTPLNQEDRFMNSNCSALALGRIGNIRSRDILIEQLLNTNSSTRSSSALGLGKIGDKESRSVLIACFQSDSKDLNESVRSACADALGEIGDVESRAALIQRLRQNNAENVCIVPYHCTEALYKIGDNESLQALIACLNYPLGDEPGYWQHACALVLCNRDCREGQNAIIARLQGTSVNDRIRKVLKVNRYPWFEQSKTS